MIQKIIWQLENVLPFSDKSYEAITWRFYLMNILS